MEIRGLFLCDTKRKRHLIPSQFMELTVLALGFFDFEVRHEKRFCLLSVRDQRKEGSKIVSLWRRTVPLFGIDVTQLQFMKNSSSMHDLSFFVIIMSRFFLIVINFSCYL